MKILGLYNKKGSKYHRILLPLSKMGADFSDSLTESHFKNYDSIWIHSRCNLHPTQVALWKKQYNCQVVVDIDDTWNILPSHPSYQALIKGVPTMKQFAIIADYVVCSTQEIEEMVKSFNSNTVVIPNRIPYGEGQYQVIEESLESFMNRKIRVGFCGSISHLEDWLSISGKMKRIINSHFKKECEFVVCGVPNVKNLEQEPWMIEKAKIELINRGLPHTEENLRLFTNHVYKKFVEYNESIWSNIIKVLGNPVVVHNRPVENYIDLYREIDILLCPLVDNDLNKCKSSLKVLEAACTDTLCILGDLYKGKDAACDFYPYENWFENINNLIKDKELLWKKKMKVSKTVRKAYSFDQDCIEPRKLILGLTNRPNLNIWGITYKDDQFTEYKEYRNKVKTVEQKSYLFENNPILNLVPTSTGKYTGVLSHKFPFKTGLSIEMVDYLLKDETADVVSFCHQEFKGKSGTSYKYLEFTEIVHPGFKLGFTKLCGHLGFQIREPKCVIYSNFWVTKSDIYKKYVNEILIPAIKFLESEEMKPYSWMDSKYKGLSPSVLKQYTGLDYYPMIVFLLERLPSMWVDNAGLTFSIKNKL